MTMLPVVRCAHCGKAHNINESILFHGMSFCSNECKDEHLKLQANQ